MTDIGTRIRWESLRSDLDHEALASKYSEGVLEGLFDAYSLLSDEERLRVDGVLAEWAESDDENRRFDGLALIRKYRIGSALPSLRNLAVRPATSKTPGAPYELDKVREIISALSAESDGT